MNKIGYSPISQPKYNLSQGKQNDAVKPSYENKEKSKAASYITKGIMAICAIGLIYSGKKVVDYYKKGIDIINLKEKIFPIPADSSKDRFKEAIIKHQYTAEQVKNLRRIYDDAEIYKNGFVGKTKKVLDGVTGFFRRNFFNY